MRDVEEAALSMFIVERGPSAGQRIPLTVFPVRIGRDPSNDIVLNDEECSRFHVRLKQRGRLVIAEDLESRNGTFINGEKILNSIVKNGDKLIIGSTELSFVTSEPDVQFATEILQYDMVVAEELGLNGPIDIDPRKSENPSFKSYRVQQEHLLNQASGHPNEIKKIFEIHGNILVAHSLEDAAKAFLKAIQGILSNTSRAAFFIWSESHRQLIPIATQHFKRKQSFLLSQRALEDVITRKQGIILLANAPHVTHNGRNRLLLPVIANDRPVCVIHVEMDDMTQVFQSAEVALLQALILRCSATFESFLLRNELDSWLVAMIETMIATVEAKDTYTRGHSERVSKYSMAIASEMRLDRETKKLLMVSSLCHDVGKIGIPDAILKKASLLSAEEYNEMKLHPTIGADIVNHMPNARRFMSGVKHHHEKWDGTGYPDGLAGEEIPFFGRIVAVADVYDAMVSGRSYSGFLNQNDAAEKIVEEKDLFDPEVIKAFQRAYNAGTLTLKTDTQNQEAHPEEQATKMNRVIVDPGKPS